jgi:hypothetical protein
MGIANGIAWFFLLGSLVWLALQGCDVIRDRYVWTLFRLPAPPTTTSPSPWPWSRWPRRDRGLVILAGLLGITSVVWALVTPLPYLLAGLVAIRLGLRSRAWWHA